MGDRKGVDNLGDARRTWDVAEFEAKGIHSCPPRYPALLRPTDCALRQYHSWPSSPLLPAHLTDLPPGSSANDVLGNGQQLRDQSATPGIKALAHSLEQKQPVRVLRGYKCRSPYAPHYGYRYDGLFKVVEVLQYVLKACDNAPELPISQFFQSGPGADPIVCPTLQKYVLHLATENVKEHKKLMLKLRSDISDTARPSRTLGSVSVDVVSSMVGTNGRIELDEEKKVEGVVWGVAWGG
eukprot:gene8206-1465_t